MADLPQLPPTVSEDLSRLLGNDVLSEASDAKSVAAHKQAVMQQARDLLKGVDPDARMTWVNAIDNAYGNRDVPRIQETRTQLRAALGIVLPKAPETAAPDAKVETTHAYGVMREILSSVHQIDDPVMAMNAFCDQLDDQRGRIAIELGITTGDVDQFSGWLRSQMNGESVPLPEHIHAAFNTAFCAIHGNENDDPLVAWGFDGSSFRRLYITPDLLNQIPPGPAQIDNAYALRIGAGHMSPERWAALQSAADEGRVHQITSVRARFDENMHDPDADRFMRIMTGATTLDFQNNDFSALHYRVIDAIGHGALRVQRLHVPSCHIGQMNIRQIHGLAILLERPRFIAMQSNGLGDMHVELLDVLTRSMAAATTVDLRGNTFNEERLAIVAQNLRSVQGTTGLPELDAEIARQRGA